MIPMARLKKRILRLGWYQTSNIDVKTKSPPKRGRTGAHSPHRFGSFLASKMSNQTVSASNKCPVRPEGTAARRWQNFIQRALCSGRWPGRTLANRLATFQGCTWTKIDFPRLHLHPNRPHGSGSCIPQVRRPPRLEQIHSAMEGRIQILVIQPWKIMKNHQFGHFSMKKHQETLWQCVMS